MALVDNAWYVDYGDGSTTGYYAITQWATGATIAAGALRRQLAAPAVGSERVFVCVVAGTTHATTEPTWTLTRGAKTTDNTVTWQECTGIAALNGDATNTPTWTITATPPGGVKNTAVTLGQVIKRDNAASYQICTTAGTAGNGAEPAFSNTAGTTTADNTVTWTSLGVVGNFTGWQAPHARLANAFTSTWGQAGNTFYFASEHAETQSTAITLTSPGSAASPCSAYCVNKSNVPPTSANLTIGASISTTGNNSITRSGIIYIRGVTFNIGNSSGTASFLHGSTVTWVFDTCAIVLGGSGASSLITCGTTGNGSANLTKLINTTVQFGNAGQGIYVVNCRFIWKNTPSAIQGATLPTTLFNSNGSSAEGCFVLLEGVDLSALGSGKTIVPSISSPIEFVLKDCKLGSSVTVAATPGSFGSAETTLVRCDSAGTNYRSEKYQYTGTETVETTIVRTGGATDGATPIAKKIITTANSKWAFPFEAIPIAIWNDSTSSITVTVYGVSAGALNNDDIWMDVEYLGAAGNPQGSFATTTKADGLATGSALTSDSSTWGGSTTKFKMSATFTPAQKGAIYIYLKAAKASTTFYIDPKPEISGVTVSKSHILAPGVYANELQSTGGAVTGISRARAASGF